MQCSDCRESLSWASGRFSKTQWMKGGAARCKSCVSASGSVGGATGDGYGGFQTVRNNNSSRYKAEDSSEGSQASIDTGYLFGSGAFKDVFKGVYVSGPRRGEDVVAKRFKEGVNSRADYFEKDVKAAQAAAKIVEKFNRINPTRIKIRINVPEIVYLEARKHLVEPFVHNWTKFNSNTGYVNDYDDSIQNQVMQALSHFSYHTSGGQFVLCDLQGGIYRDGIILSDPIILSRCAERYGGGDLGPKGISNFFYHHRCNRFCDTSWQTPTDRNQYFHADESSSLLGNRGIPTAHWVHTLGALAEFSEEDEDEDEDYW